MKSLEVYLSKQSLNYKTPAIVMGSAPSVKMVEKLALSAVRIGVGDMPVRAKKLGPYDYWVTANSYYPLPWISKDAKDIENSEAITLIATMAAQHSLAPQEEIFAAIEEVANSEKIILYNQKHFQNKSCVPKGFCCEISRKLVNGSSIQELLGKLNNSDSAAYGQGSTVALHGYALAVLLKANPIYLAGIELPIRYKDYKAYNNLFRPNEKFQSKLKRVLVDYVLRSRNRATDFGYAGRENILNDFRAIFEVSKSLGITTFVVGETSPLNLIEGIQNVKVH